LSGRTEKFAKARRQIGQIRKFRGIKYSQKQMRPTQGRKKSPYLQRKVAKICPVEVLRQILSLTPKEPQTPLLQNILGRAKAKKFSGQMVSYNLLRAVVKRALTAIGEDATGYGTHSLRAGGATAAAAAKMEPRLMQRHGRWARSESMNTYIDDDVTEKLRVSKAAMSSQ
jgi:hypothetical protein